MCSRVRSRGRRIWTGEDATIATDLITRLAPSRGQLLVLNAGFLAAWYMYLSQLPRIPELEEHPSARD
jgi:hypothetical protein